MEKLLTIKEAAAFLNVSEMSLRRWTNTGKLKCYRLGGKNERRFIRRELENLLRPDEKGVPLGISNAAVKDSSHIAHFYKDPDESVMEGSAFLQSGLSRGESILIVSTEERSSQILANLNDLGFPVNRLRRTGLIVVSNGQSSFHEQLRFMTDIMARCPHGKGFRLLGDMVWAIEKGWDLEQINRLESKTNQVLTGNNRMFLCQYDLTRFGADGAMMAFDTHDLTVYRGEVRQSPYFTGSAV
ncbi:MAG: MEDS domain-containing protein [Deltaproteobacteria bacterium]|nr:MEDS domain-containing protein [Deltaproteobacteria bacterium]MBW2659444.1 MEDS domain-containing protein [Deltaproteobacteria bacterium]